MKQTTAWTINVGIVSMYFVTSSFAGDINPPSGPIAPTQRKFIRSLPYEIHEPGSYVVAGNLVAPGGTHGIIVTAHDVTIDLNGHSLDGFINSLNCIELGSLFNNLTVRNGTIISWANGVNCPATCIGGRFENIRSYYCGGAGMILPSNAIVANCAAYSNSGPGIRVFSDSTVTNCTAFNNGGTGIWAFRSCSITNCVSKANGWSAAGGHGIFVEGGGALVSGCTVDTNGTGSGTVNDGINVLDYCSIINCCVMFGRGDAIQVSSNCTVLQNGCANAGVSGSGAGIHATGLHNRIEANTCLGSTRGIDVDSAGNFIIRNICSGNTTNWDIVANNVFGPIVDRSAPASPAVLGNSAASSLSTTDPNANFTY